MNTLPRIGTRIGSNDPFWVQTGEAVARCGQQRGIDLYPIDMTTASLLRRPDDLVDEILAQDLDALICSYLPETIVQRILAHSIPVIQLTESELFHPLFSSPYGFYEIAQQMGHFLVEQLHEQGNLLIIGGMMATAGEDGRSRIAGIFDLLHDYPQINIQHIPSAWRDTHAAPQIEAALRNYPRHVDAVFGLSDSLALVTRTIGQTLGCIDQHTLVVGINGDPLALTAIAAGDMLATIDTPTDELGYTAIEIALRASQGQEIPHHFGYKPQLITRENVATIALHKLQAIAELPNRLVGVHRQRERQRLAQLEASLAINQRVGAILNRRQLVQEITELIRQHFGYGSAQLWMVNQERDQLLREATDTTEAANLPIDRAGMLAQAIEQNRPIYIPYIRRAHGDDLPEGAEQNGSRLIIPVRFGGTPMGVLALASDTPTHETQQAIAGLQVLADQLGIALRNAELYEEAVSARAAAEQANQLKTRLLANVSHELRTPLNIILGYSQSALSNTSPYAKQLSDELRQDIERIYQSGQHLIRLINDLLDLSRAEIAQLELYPETITARSFLADVLQNVTETFTSHQVEWRLNVPEQLPLLQADPVRLRQILFNLLSNAHKFTLNGWIELGARVEDGQLHLWIADNGIGITPELQERIFEPFVTGDQLTPRPEGVGLGLSITRRLVALHEGKMWLESTPGGGSTFHISLPLPSDQQLTTVILKGSSVQAMLKMMHTMGQLGAEGPVLIVDDDAATRELHASLAARSFPGRAIMLAEHGTIALELIEHVTPSLVVLDLMMPDIDGFAVLEVIRSRPATRRVPTIIMSGHPLNADDVQRLNYPQVSLHTKEILSHEEVTCIMQHSLINGHSLAPTTSLLVKQAIAFIQQRYTENLSRQAIADAIGVSPHYLTQIFREETGLSPWEYLNRYRIREAKRLLHQSQESISEIAAQVGFEDASYFARVFRREVGCSPIAFREGGNRDRVSSN